jgi:hypothetical protein
MPLLSEEHWNGGGRPVSYSHIFIICNTKKQLSIYGLVIITDELLTHYSVPDEKLSVFCRPVSFSSLYSPQHQRRSVPAIKFLHMAYISLHHKYQSFTENTVLSSVFDRFLFYYYFLVESLTVYSKLSWLHYSHLLAPHGWVSYSRTVYLHPGCPGSASETQCGRFLSNTTKQHVTQTSCILFRDSQEKTAITTTLRHHIMSLIRHDFYISCSNVIFIFTMLTQF